MAILFAATYPERTRALVLYGAYAKRLDPDDDYPWAPTREERAALHRSAGARLGLRVRHEAHVPARPTRRWRAGGASAAAPPPAPAPSGRSCEMNSLIDVRDVLPAIRVPTLVVHRGTDYDVARRGRPLHRRADRRRPVRRAAGSRPLRRRSTPTRSSTPSSRSSPAARRRAEPGPRPGDACSSPTSSVDERPPSAATVLADRSTHDDRAQRARPGIRGREVEALGDGFLATFDGPARAVRCAPAIVRRAPRARRSTSGPACTPARSSCRRSHRRRRRSDRGSASAAAAAPGEVLVSQTVDDLVAGSGLEFADRGRRALAGVPGEWRLLAVVDVARSSLCRS